MQSGRRYGSLAWCASDFRSLIPGASAGLMQLMYPPLGHAVMEHSAFIDDPFGRVYRSIPQIWATILTPDGDHRAKHIRDLHRDIKGADDHGERYHALDPETFWWAHATFTWEMFRSIELFHRRQLTADERARLYDDTVEWYERYGVSMRPVPATLTEFDARFGEICGDVLELTPSAAYAIRIAQTGRISLPARTVAFGCLPSPLRKRMEIPWTTTDRRAFGLFVTSAKTGFTVMPRAVNQRTLRWSLRQVGARTRHDRYQPAA